MSNIKRTRFPPEPNGYIHLGHVKAMLFDFNFNKNCECILRMDDTNPQTEKQEYVDAIVNDVKWLGFEFCKLTYTSDYFDDLYKFALDLIKKDKAYVDFSLPEEIKEMRHKGIESKYRSKSVEWNLIKFDDMKSGKFKENEVVLRLKIDMKHDNHSLRDPIAYRIRLAPHYRTINKWCIYPSYDYSHGIVDALEGITDSYCTMEFYNRREQYYWSVKQLGLTAAVVSEFGKLNIENVSLSKRKIIPLIENKILSGFDDPRLYTIRGLRRRGYTAEILKNIVSKTTINFSRSEPCISKGMIEHELRAVLERTSPRAFAVLDPLTLCILNYTDDEVCTHPNHPVDKTMGSHNIIFTKNIYIDRNDFRVNDDPSYYRLAPDKTVRLRYSNFIKCDSYDLNSNTIYANITSPEKPNKIKGIIHWLNEMSPCAIFEIYEDLYDKKDTFTNSIKQYKGYVEEYVIEEIKNKGVDTVMQFERLGYFKLDRYSDNIPIFIQIIGLVDKYNKSI